MGKADVIAKEFWQDNARFADFFNAVVFGGKSVICPEELNEMDTEASMTVKSEKNYIQTITKARDVIRKYTSDAEFVLLGIENQQRINYAEPICSMVYDAAGYWKECRTISQRNKAEKPKILENTWAELFSLERGAKLHPVITVVLYYGEKPWDGARSLHEMLVPVSEGLLKMVPDYSINLVEIRESENLIFHNQEVKQLFWALQKIHQGKIEELEGVMVKKDTAELIGAVTGAKKILNKAKKIKDGETMELCDSLKKIVKEHERIGEIRGESNGIKKGRILSYYDVGWEEERIAQKLKISRKEVQKVLKKSGKSI